ncbi:serine/threonine protein kinase [Pendulispora albinea]|uniref:Serine/threonine protein kinase n=1 Tax=Pendulispora albinea TaxID=2741071 RepID=A0ABZ2M6Y2_9BACT
MGAPVKIGDILASKYRVERVLGRGGMGMVVAARHMQLGSLVALKFMIPSKFDVHDAAGRFVREARAAARLRSEHIARVSDYGVLDTGAPYIVMEFLEGADLHAVMKARGRLPIHEAVAYLIDVCKAMTEAHALGIVHRDLKPQNLLLTHRFDGTPLIKVLDFGISKFTNEADGQDMLSTTTGSLLGSPGFMAPEQMCNSKDVDARADIYALGGIAFRLLTGELPFQEGSFAEMVAAVLYKHPRRVRALRPEIPSELEALIACCLQKEPNGRYSSMDELMTVLQSIADRLRPAQPSETIDSAQSTVMPRPVSDEATGETTYVDALLSPPRLAGQTIGDAAVPMHTEIHPPSKSSFRGPIGGISILGILAMLALCDFVLHERGQRLRDAAPMAERASAPAPGMAPERTPPAGEAEPAMMARLANAETTNERIDAGPPAHAASSAAAAPPARSRRPPPKPRPDDLPPDLDLLK